MFFNKFSEEYFYVLMFKIFLRNSFKTFLNFSFELSEQLC